GLVLFDRVPLVVHDGAAGRQPAAGSLRLHQRDPAGAGGVEVRLPPAGVRGAELLPGPDMRDVRRADRRPPREVVFEGRGGVVEGVALPRAVLAHQGTANDETERVVAD